MQVTIDKITRNEINTQFGLKKSIGLKIKESQVYDVNGALVQVNDRYINTFDESGTQYWKEGDVVEIAIVQKGQYLNFKASKAKAPSTAPAQTFAQSNENPDTPHETTIADILKMIAGLDNRLRKLELEDDGYGGF